MTRLRDAWAVLVGRKVAVAPDAWKRVFSYAVSTSSGRGGVNITYR